MPFRLGKLAPKRRLGIPALGDYLDKATTWPTVPPQGWEAKVDPTTWGVLGNDLYGCCAPAALLHILQAQSANAGNPLHATTEQCLALYSAVTGFNPSDPSTDQGTVVSDLLAYVQKNGVEMTDATGKVVTVEIVGSASLDPSSIAQMRYASYLFGGSILGVNLPQQCEEDTANWNFGDGLPLAGGHAIARVGEGGAGGKVVTWGLVVPYSNPFFASYGDEAYIVIAKPWIDAQGSTPSGTDLDGLVAAAKTL